MYLPLFHKTTSDCRCARIFASIFGINLNCISRILYFYVEVESVSTDLAIGTWQLGLVPSFVEPGEVKCFRKWHELYIE